MIMILTNTICTVSTRNIYYIINSEYNNIIQLTTNNHIIKRTHFGPSNKTNKSKSKIILMFLIVVTSTFIILN